MKVIQVYNKISNSGTAKDAHIYILTKWCGVRNNKNSFKWLNLIPVRNLLSLPLLTISKWNLLLVQEFANLRPLLAVCNSDNSVLKHFLVPKTALNQGHKNQFSWWCSQSQIQVCKGYGHNKEYSNVPSPGNVQKSCLSLRALGQKWGTANTARLARDTGKVLVLWRELNKSLLLLVFPCSKP